MRDDERILLHEIEKLEAENAALRQQVDALSRALAADTDEYRALVEAFDSVTDTDTWVADIFIHAAKFIVATEAAKANAGAGSGDGEAG